jgi:hypothetical protein
VLFSVFQIEVSVGIDLEVGIEALVVLVAGVLVGLVEVKSILRN